jgi:hypothetical protein
MGGGYTYIDDSGRSHIKKIVIIAITIGIIFIFACSKKQNNPIAPNDFTNTPTSINIQTATITKTYTASPIVSPTSTATITPTQTMITCIYPAIGGFDTAGQYAYNFPYYFDYDSGVINAKIFAEAGRQLKMAIYDGAGNKLTWDDSILGTDSNGYYSRNYTIAATGDTLTPWHIAIIDSANALPLVYNPSDTVFLDTQVVHVAKPAPTPIPPTACANEPLLFCDSNHSMQKYEFKNKNCVELFYVMGYAYGYSMAKVAYYDGNDDLIFVDTQAVNNYSVFSTYTVDATKTSGTWHIILYDSSYSPPSKFNISTPYYGTCPSYITCKIE